MGWWHDVATWTWASNRVYVDFGDESFNIGFNYIPEEGVRGDFEFTEGEVTENGSFITDEVIGIQSLIH